MAVSYSYLRRIDHLVFPYLARWLMDQIVVERSCGLDVHRDTVVACIVVAGQGSRPRKETRTFSTFTADLVELGNWLMTERITHVGMESTGVYWRPVYAVLEGAAAFELIVGNAQHMKNVPGRKTDVKDAEWIATLIRFGLVAKSYVPPADLRELRDLVRYRRSIVQARSAERNRLQKLLETANVKLASVASDVFGMSGMAMLRAMAKGETDPAVLAELAQGLLRRKLPELRRALDGRLADHHRFLLATQLERLDTADAQVEKLEAEIDRRVVRNREALGLLTTIPGVKHIVAVALLAEMGPDMSVFKSAGHAAAWAGICPGNNESAGRSRAVTARKGNVHLRSVLVEAAQAARNTKGTYLRDKYHRLKARRGNKKAIVAIAHKILTSAYRVLMDRKPYKDLGEAYLDQQDETRVANQLVRRLKRLGYEVNLERKAA